MVTSPTGKGVIAIGGRTAGSVGDSKEIFELSTSMQWTKLEPTLKIDHQAFFAIPLREDSVRRKIELDFLKFLKLNLYLLLSLLFLELITNMARLFDM